jgi:hypothetical protein
MVSYNKLLDFSNNEFCYSKTNYNCLSYKNKDKTGNSGSFSISGLYILNMLKNDDNKYFALTPIKSEFYPLYFDFDNKPDHLFNNKNDFNSIVHLFIKIIIDYIHSISFNSNTSYIFSHKFFNPNDGVHLYFPHIIVNKIIHSNLYSNILKIALDNINSLSHDSIHKIFDKCVVSNALRLFYFYYNNDFYFPSTSLSTFSFDNSPSNNIHLSFLNTTLSSHNINFISPDLFLFSSITSKSSNSSKSSKSSNSTINSISSYDISYLQNIIDINFLSNSNKLDFVSNLLDILHPSYFNSYHKWIKVIFLLKNLNFLQLAHSFSKKSSKYNHSAVLTINNIFNVNNIISLSSTNSSKSSNSSNSKINASYNRPDNSDSDDDQPPFINNNNNNDNFDISKDPFYIFNIKEIHDNIRTLHYQSIIHSNKTQNNNKTKNQDNKTENEDITIGSLIYWAFDSDFFGTIDILEKNNINLKLDNKIKNIDDIILKNNKHKIDYSENSIYISETFKNIFIPKINHIFTSDNPIINSIIIHSPTGSGKTTLINAILNVIPPHARVLSIVCRRSMVATHNNAFLINNKKLFSNYLDFPNCFNFSLYFNKYFICSLDSLVKLGNNSYDVLILDEISSLISYFYSDTLANKRVDCLNKLKFLIDNAKFIIACDSQITDCCFELLKNKKIYYYKNYSPNKKNIPFIIYQFPKFNKSTSSKIFVNNLNYFVNFIYNKSIKFKYSTIIYLDSLTILHSLKNHLLFITNNHNLNLDTSDNNFIDFNEYFLFFSSEEGSIDTLNNINSIAKNKCIITTPKITTGLDILCDYSDNVYCLYNNIYKDKSMDIFSYYQQLSRSRNATKINFFLLNSSNKYNKIISFNKNKEIEDNEIINCLHYLKNNVSIDNKHKIKSDINNIDFFTNINYFHSWYNRLFNSNKLNILKLILESVGYSISNILISNINYENSIDPNIKSIIDDNNTNYSIMLSDFYDNNNIHNYDPKFNELYELINRRKIYVNDSVTNKKEICCDTKLFNNFINKTILTSSNENFKQKLFNDYLNNSCICLKNNTVFNQIKAIQFIENKLNISRFQFDFSLSFDQIQTFKNDLIANKNLFNCFNGFKYNNKTNNIISKCESFHNITSRIICFLIDCYNDISEGIVKYDKHNFRIYNFNNFYNTDKKILIKILNQHNIQFNISDIKIINTTKYENIIVNS